MCLAKNKPVRCDACFHSTKLFSAVLECLVFFSNLYHNFKSFVFIFYSIYFLKIAFFSSFVNFSALNLFQDFVHCRYFLYDCKNGLYVLKTSVKIILFLSSNQWKVFLKILRKVYFDDDELNFASKIVIIKH